MNFEPEDRWPSSAAFPLLTLSISIPLPKQHKSPNPFIYNFHHIKNLRRKKAAEDWTVSDSNLSTINDLNKAQTKCLSVLDEHKLAINTSIFPIQRDKNRVLPIYSFNKLANKPFKFSVLYQIHILKYLCA